MLTEVHKASFSGRCAPNIVLVYLGRESYPVRERQQEANGIGLDFPLRGIYRGRLGVYKSTKPKRGQDSLPFIHTTNMRKGELVGVGQEFFGEFSFGCEKKCKKRPISVQ